MNTKRKRGYYRGKKLEVLKEAWKSWLSFADVQRKDKNPSKLVPALEYNDFEVIPDQAYADLSCNAAEVLGWMLTLFCCWMPMIQKSLVVYYEEGEESNSDIDLRRKVKRKNQ